MPEDRELEALRLAAEQDPSDRQLRTRYVSELIRAGRGDEARRLMMDSYLCPKAWDDLEPILGDERRCDDCQEVVREARDVETLGQLAAQGRCAAAPPAVLMEYTQRLIQEASEQGAALPEPSCVLSVPERPPIPGGMPIAIPTQAPEPIMGAMPAPPDLRGPGEDPSGEPLSGA